MAAIIGGSSPKPKQQQSSFSIESMILPPHWRSEEADAGKRYFNDFTGEETSQHPFERYLDIIQAQMHLDQAPGNDCAPNSADLDNTGRNNSPPEPPQPSSPRIIPPVGILVNSTEEKNASSRDLMRPTSKVRIRDFDDNIFQSPNGGSRGLVAQDLEGLTSDEANFGLGSSSSRQRTPSNYENREADSPEQIDKKPVYEYQCQWKERNLFGHVSIYGLTLRFNPDDGTTLVKFDGIREGEWTFTHLQGPYGVIEMHDLFIGAKIEVFGRHLTISSANGPAVRWIRSEAKRLMKLQTAFQARIESVGHKPIVPKPEVKVIQNIQRDTKTGGMANLRKLSMDCAKLGEQVAQLGLAHMAAI